HGGGDPRGEANQRDGEVEGTDDMTTTARSLVAALAVAAAVAIPLATVASGQLSTADQSIATVKVSITAGRSTVLATEFDVTRIAITNPGVADATVVEPREVLIDGKAPGTVTMILWGTDRRVQYDIVVDPGVSALQQQLRALYPGEDINVQVNEEATTLSGQ